MNKKGYRVVLRKEDGEGDYKPLYDEANEGSVQVITEKNKYSDAEDLMAVKINLDGQPLPKTVRTKDVTGAPIDRLLKKKPSQNKGSLIDKIPSIPLERRSKIKLVHQSW